MYQSSNSFMLALAVICMALLAGCNKQPSSPSPAMAETNSPSMLASNVTVQSVPTNNVRSFNTRGVIRKLPPGGKTLLVSHDDIPGFMPRMTMEFDVRHPNELNGLKVGDVITFKVMATEEDSWIESIQGAGAATNSQPVSSEPTAASILHAAQLKPGELLPDVELLGEDGRPAKLSDFGGRALAFTFIFTRCPLPNFCPRMNQNFYHAREALLRNGSPTNWHFLSISFDPDFDKPGVLSRYAYSYRGENSNGWSFASASSNVVAAMSPLLDFRFANENGSFQHNLRTVVLDPQRRIFKHFEGNSWSAAELATAMSQAANRKETQEIKR